jgi:3-hydroxyisobutyrate dehydrogenase/2-hydroxy-3-oxopropionate reductase
MAARLRDAGHELVVWNRTREKAEAIGVEVAASPSEAAQGAEVVFTMLADPEALHAVAKELLTGLRDETVLVEMSTAGPAAIRALDHAALLDAPVLGSLSEAEAGTLKLFVGGEGEIYERARPLLEALGEPLRVGPLGSGAAAKLVANASLVGVLALLGETLALADALGLPRETTWQVLAATPLAAQAERRRPAIEADDYPPRFRLSLARKDADLVQDATSLDLPLLAAARAHFAAAESAALGDLDYAAVLRHLLAR